MSRASRRRSWRRWKASLAASRAPGLALALFALLVLTLVVVSVIVG
jgi:hypothetical protein